MFSVAGSGKTSFIINSLSPNESALILTYTINNSKNIKQRILQKWGYIPDQIRVMTYFTFLYSFCFKPLLGHQLKTKGLIFEPGDTYAVGDARYISSGRRLFSNRLAKLFEVKSIEKEINQRITKYYKNLYIDEVQDFAGHDFNFLKSIANAPINVIMVGDFFQHTFDTSRDGTVNKSLYDCISKYQAQFSKMGLDVDRSTLSKSYRCSQEVCDFIKTNLGIMIESHREDSTSVRIVKNETDANAVIEDSTTVKLFYQKHYVHGCYSRNWGDCKGENHYHHVCVVLSHNQYNLFRRKKQISTSQQTLNKLYVACSRAKGDLIIMPEIYLTGLDNVQ